MVELDVLSLIRVNAGSFDFPPRLDLNGAFVGTGVTTTAYEGDPPKPLVLPDATVTDPHSTTFISATAVISNRRDAGAELLAADTTGTNIDAFYNAATGVLGLNGVDTLDNYQKVLRTVTYQNISQAPTTGLRRIDFVAYDGAFVSPAAVTDLQFNANNNNPPILDLNGPAILGRNVATTAYEGDPPKPLVLPDATVTDPDPLSTTLVSATAVITNRQDASAELLAADTTGTNIDAFYNAATGVLGLNGVDTLDNYQKVLRTVTYQNNSQAPTTGLRRIDFVAYDGSFVSPAATTTVQFFAIDILPSLDVKATTQIDLSTIRAGFRSQSAVASDSVSSAGDVNGAGLEDVTRE